MTVALPRDHGDGSRVRARHARPWRRLEPLRPPLTDPRFWEIQALVAMAAGTHHAMEAFDLMSSMGTLYLVLVLLLFVVPVLLAAVNFGRSGAVTTGLWSLALTVPNLVIWHSGADRYGEVAQFVIINVVAVLLGWWVDAEASARHRAEAAGAALRASEAKYRGLFETAGEPVLLLDRSGVIQEANAAACRLFGLRLDTARGRSLGDIGAGAILNAAAEARSRAAEVVLRTPGGQKMWVEPVWAPLTSQQDGLIQLILRDVTSQRRRQRSLEAYAARILEAQEEERKRIAQEIHDGAIHELVLLCRRLDTASRACAVSPAAASAEIQGARALADSVAESLRKFARDLRPSVLDDLGLIPAIRRLLTETEANSNVKVSLVVRGDPRRLPGDDELALFRIAQEALRNAVRHSGASRVGVQVDFSPCEVVLRVSDDGAGFAVPASLHELAAHGKLGLLGMHERARLIQAGFEIVSAPRTGTTVAVKIRR